MTNLAHLASAASVRSVTRRAFAPLLLCAAALTACRSSQPDARPNHASGATDEADPADAAAATSTALGAHPAASGPVGLADLEPPSAEAVRHNDAGVGLLVKGKLDEARKELTAALTATPSFTLARYNLACAYARSAENDKAARELAQVFEEDFVGTRVHAAADTDLTTFWTTPEGVALAARTTSYQARYKEVIDRGVRAILWRDEAKPGAGPADGRGFLRPTYVRVGVFDPQTKRFVPTAPRLAHTIRAFAPPNVRYAVIVTGEVRATLAGDMDAGQALDAVYAFPFDPSGAELAHVALAHADAIFAALSLADDQLQLDLRSAVPLPGTRDGYGALYKVVFGQPPVHAASSGASKAPEGYEIYKTHIDAGYNHWGPTMFASDARYRYKASAKDGVLSWPTGETVSVPSRFAHRKGTPRILPDSSGEHVLLLWNAEDLQCDHSEIPGRFQLALVTRTGSVVTSLGTGKGAAAGGLDAAGRLYVQRDRKVVQVDLRDFSETPLPDGVLLTPPNIDDPECGF